MKNVVPKGLTRVANRQLLKLNANSPTILVVAGVVGFGATAVLAARATRNIDPIFDEHAKGRVDIDSTLYQTNSARGKAVSRLYLATGYELTKLYAPTIAVGTLSTASVLYGHKILKGRHVATMAAYSGLMEQFQAYRSRVAKTLGEDAERDIYRGAHGEWAENEKGESKLGPVHNDLPKSYLTPWFDHTNVNWTRDPQANYLFLKGVQNHMNQLLTIRGHVFLNDIMDALRMPRTPEGQQAGWVYPSPHGDGFIDFGFMTGQDPNTVAFRNGAENCVQLNFNIDGIVWNLI